MIAFPMIASHLLVGRLWVVGPTNATWWRSPGFNFTVPKAIEDNIDSGLAKPTKEMQELCSLIAFAVLDRAAPPPV